MKVKFNQTNPLKSNKKLSMSELEKIQGGTHCYEKIAERSNGHAKPPEGVLNVVNC